MTKKEQIYSDKLIDELIAGVSPADITSRDGLFGVLKKRIIERMLNAELDHNLGYNKHSKEAKDDPNRRNGSYDKTLIDTDGNKITVEVPRDRNSDFVPKGMRRLKGFDGNVISLYARGMTTSEIQGHLEDIYNTEVSKDLISTIIDSVIDEVTKWQSRPLDHIYSILYLDCIYVKSRDNHTVINKAVYLTIGVNMEGKKELLGIWISKTEGSKFWMQVITELKARGIEQIYIACVDGLKGFSDAINSIFPNTIVQLCIVHMVRNSVKYVSYKDLKSVVANLKLIYNAINENMALLELDQFADNWDNKYPVISDMWKRN